MNVSKKKYLTRTGFATFTPKAALFDMDGVLYDSMKNHAVAWHESMASFGLHMLPEEAYSFEGMRGVETIQLLAQREWGRRVSDEEAMAMYRSKSEAYAACPPADLIPGVHELQEYLVSRGLIVGVVTGSGQRTLLQRILDDFNGLVSPEVMVTAADIEHGKPAPDPYQKGMRKAGIEPWQTIVIENAPLGVRSAVAAGCFTIAVNTGPLPDTDLEQEGADLVLSDMFAAKSAVAELLKEV